MGVDDLMLTREQILAAADLPREKVEVPEWGGTVYVAAMSGVDRDAFEAAVITDDGTPDLRNMRARLAALTLVDEDGKRIFSESDIAALGLKSAKALERVAKVSQRLNRLGDSELEKLKGN